MLCVQIQWHHEDDVDASEDSSEGCTKALEETPALRRHLGGSVSQRGSSCTQGIPYPGELSMTTGSTSGPVGGPQLAVSPLGNGHVLQCRVGQFSDALMY